MFLRLPSSTLQLVGTFLSMVLTMLRAGVPPNRGQVVWTTGVWATLIPFSKLLSSRRSMNWSRAGSEFVCSSDGGFIRWDPAKNAPNRTKREPTAINQYFRFMYILNRMNFPAGMFLASGLLNVLFLNREPLFLLRDGV